MKRAYRRKKTVKNLRWTATVWCKDRWPLEKDGELRIWWAADRPARGTVSL